MDELEKANARLLVLERELFRLQQLRLEAPDAVLPEPSPSVALGAAEKERAGQLHDQNLRLSAYGAHLREKLERLQHTLTETRRTFSIDPLTGLAGAAELVRLLGERVEGSRAGREASALLLVEVDRAILDRTLGPQRGDWLMRQTVPRLQALVLPEDSLGRWGDSQFLLLLKVAPDQKAALGERLASLAQRAQQTLEKPFDFGGIPITVQSYAGGLLLDGEDAFAALEHVRQTLRLARAPGGCPFRIYGEELRERARRIANLSGPLAHARLLGQLQVHYQPIIASGDGKTAGLETRLRWNRPEGVIEARQFFEVLEDTGQVLATDEWVMAEACRQASTLERVYVAVNLTTAHLLVADLPRRIAHILEASGLSPERLCIELSEQSLAQASERVGALARELSRMGVSVAIDGFGSRLSSLAGLPVRFLKLDSVLVAHLEQSECQRLCRASLELAHQLGIKVIAKRVETAAQVAWLRQAGCDYLEGHFFSAPVPLDDVAALIERSWQA